MKISSRNQFEGRITALKSGPINAEVELTTGGGDKIVAVITQNSVETLELAVGKPAVALIKAPWVMILADDGKFMFSARNRLTGTVTRLVKGAVNAEVVLKLPGGSDVYSIITNDAALELGLKEGGKATALFKASSVVLGISK
ncbi:MAG: TOBE domain-containing protein [Prolixibacteraceae bacterium]|nr:TOBE domain-containing protein [Burkholderiales bacterium]